MKVIDLEKWLKKKFQKTSNKEEDKKLDKYDRYQKQRKWREKKINDTK